MIKYLLLAIVLGFSTNIKAETIINSELLKNSLYNSYCFNKKRVIILLQKSLVDSAIEKNFKGKENYKEKYKAYIKGKEEGTRLYKIQAIKYNGYNDKLIKCSLVFSLKPNKQQKELDHFFANYYIIIEKIMKNHSI